MMLYTKKDLGEDLKDLVEAECDMEYIGHKMFDLFLETDNSLNIESDVISIASNLMSMEQGKGFEYPREQLHGIAEDLLKGDTPLFRNDCCFCGKYVFIDNNASLYIREMWGNKLYEDHDLLKSHFSCFQSKVFKKIKFNNNNEEIYECYFCSKKIEQKQYGIIPIALIKESREPKDRKETTLYTHLDCLKKMVHPKVFLYGKKIQDVI